MLIFFNRIKGIAWSQIFAALVWLIFSMNLSLELQKIWLKSSLGNIFVYSFPA